jgi:hypothetical protein
MTLIKFMKRGTILDDAPWEWGSTGGWSNGMPTFFATEAAATKNATDPLTYNVFDDLDTNPVTYSNAPPVDPTVYQNEYIGNVIGIY